MTNIRAKKNRYPLRKFALTTLAACMSTGALAAQGGLMLEEVVVTAQKRAQSLQDVPVTVSAVTEDALRNAGIQSLNDVKKLVPALNIFSAGNPARTSITIRGAGTGASDPSLEPSVGVFIDGAYMPRSVYGLSELVDVERIEVLMGPQGTLYGKNTNSGVLSVTTKGAPTELEASIETTLGDFNQRDATVSIGAPISDSLSYRFSAKGRNRDGVLEDVNNGSEYNDIDKQAYRGQLFWEPSDELSVRAIGYYSKGQSNRATEVQLDPDGLYLSLLKDTADYLGRSDQFDGDIANYKSSFSVHSDSILEVRGGSLQLDYELNNGITLTSLSSIQSWESTGFQNDMDGSPLDLISTNDSTEDESFGQEIRLSSPGGETVDWLAGAYYFTSEMEMGSKDQPRAIWGADAPALDAVLDARFGGIWSLIGASGAVGHSLNNWSRHESESVAAFGQATWNIREATSVTMGLRYAREEKSFSTYTEAFDAAGVSYADGGDFNRINAKFSGVLANPGYAATELTDELTDESVTGMLSVNHFIGDTMLYATVATGTKSGGFNGNSGELSLEDRNYDTEKTTNYEIGAKIDGLLDGRARVNLSYFYTDYKDFQATVFNAEVGAFQTANAARQLTQGVNVDSTLLVSENLMLVASLQYLDAIFKDFEGAACHPEANAEVIQTGVCDYSGQRMAFAPNWSGSLSANYVRPLQAGAEFYAHLSGNFKTTHLVNNDRGPTADERVEQLDGRMGWRNEQWDVALWATNLTDRSYQTATSENTLAAAVLKSFGTSRQDYNSWLNSPRTFGVTGRYQF